MYSTQKYLFSHKRYMHDKTKLIICVFCAMTFNRNSQLKYQFNCVHTDVGLYTCTVEGCDKHFVIKSDLTIHEIIHTEE